MRGSTIYRARVRNQAKLAYDSEECSACNGSDAQHRKDKKSIFSSLAKPAPSDGEKTCKENVPCS